jgi:hypothetical protein
VELLYKPYHDRGIFEIKVGGKVIQTVDAFAPVLRLIWWTAVTLPTGAEVTVVAAGRRAKEARDQQQHLRSAHACRTENSRIEFLFWQDR